VLLQESIDVEHHSARVNFLLANRPLSVKFTQWYIKLISVSLHIRYSFLISKFVAGISHCQTLSLKLTKISHEWSKIFLKIGLKSPTDVEPHLSLRSVKFVRSLIARLVNQRFHRRLVVQCTVAYIAMLN
jgi:hypothetical protein